MGSFMPINELVEGKGQFDLALTDEYLEGQVLRLDPRVMSALKAGACRCRIIVIYTD